MSTKLQTLAVLWSLFGVYRMLSPPKLQTLAVLWPLFGVYIEVAIKLLNIAVLWPQHSNYLLVTKLQTLAIKLQTLAVQLPLKEFVTRVITELQN